MLQRKYQVFISSTFQHMEGARKAAVAGVSDCRHIPIALDNFAPQSAADLDVIKQEVGECQVYVLILGPVYGAVPDNEERSYTRIEYQLARAAGREILVFPLNWDDVVAQRRKLDPDSDGKELANTENLRDFYAEVQKDRHFARQWRWDSAEDIRRFVIMALSDLPSRPDAPRGLIPEPDFEHDLVDSVAENEFLRDTVTAIRSFDKLYKRTTTNVEAKLRAAEFLAQRYHARMAAESTEGVFFESGSSVAFVAKTLPHSLWDRVRFGTEGEPRKRVSTNNVLVYLLLWLNKGVPCGHFPWGLPENTYGASYGPIGLLDAREPNYQGRPLNTRAREAIKSLGEARLALTSDNTSLIITAASGLQLSEEHILEAEEGYEIPVSVERAVNECYGPHVGSYNNKVFKRYLYETGLPTILVLDSGKVDSPIDATHCHFFFDEEWDWETVCAEHPLAICLGCETSELDRLVDLISERLPGFETITTEKARPYSALLARNGVFMERFPEDTGLGAK